MLAYAANNAEDIGDYSTATLAPIGTFSTAGLLAGSPVSFDTTSIYNTQLGLGASSLGFRLQTTPATVTGGGAFTFDSFTLTVTPVPEPGALGMLAAVAALAASGYRSPAARSTFLALLPASPSGWPSFRSIECWPSESSRWERHGFP